MKKRVLSAIALVLIAVPILLAGGKVFSIAVGLLSVLALKEFLDLPKSHHKIPNGLILFSMVVLVLLVFYEYEGHAFSYGVSQRFLILLFLGFLFPAMFHFKKGEYQTQDAFYLFGIVVFLGLCFNSLIMIRERSLPLLGYLIFVPMITDVFAFLIGSWIGKRKIAPYISPNKTLAGSVSGTLIATILASIYYFYFVSMDDPILILSISFLLSIAAQFGDLLFSKIKRENDIKDYSNLIPGHGGILDRCDSFFIVLLVYVLFLKFI